MTSLALAVLATALIQAASSADLKTVNDWDKKVSFSCPPNQMITRIGSNYDDNVGDRRWAFACTYAPAGAELTECSWSGYANEFEDPAIYNCHDGGVLTGWESYHENRPTEDRRTKYRCCKPKGYRVHSCYYTGFVDCFQETVNMRVPDGWALTGVFSYFSRDWNDRRFSFNICAVDFAA